MFLNRVGFPEESELVLCTVTKIFHHSVFADLDEYHKSGMIHISEVSPGRIRNIRDFVKEGKKVVCKVLNINSEKGHIDLSLRRVNERQKKEKLSEIKQEQRSEKIVEFVAKDLKVDAKKLYDEIFLKISEGYELLHLCFWDIVKGEVSLEELGIDKKKADIFTKVIKERMKPAEVFIEGDLTLKTYDSNGVEIIKNTLNEALDGDNIVILVEGGGKYKIRVKAAEYKTAEKILQKSVDNAISFIEKQGGEGQFVKAE
jgi:translation initiation factor 2 subunit 1